MMDKGSKIFSPKKLPPLLKDRITTEQLHAALEVAQNKNKTVYIYYRVNAV